MRVVENQLQLRFQSPVAPTLPPANDAHLILVDTSGTMRMICPALKERKLDAALSMAKSFCQGLQKFSPFSLYAFATLTAVVRVRNARFSGVVPEIEIPANHHYRFTPLWEGLRNATASFPARMKRQRILLITDCENSFMSETQSDIDICFKTLQEKGIVVDVLVLPNSNNEESKDHSMQRFLSSVCASTGGFLLSANRLNKDSLIDILQSEQFCDLSLDRTSQSLGIPMNVAPRYRQSQPVFNVELPNPKDYREYRIIEGIKLCQQYLTVFQIETNNVDVFRVMLPGPFSKGCDTKVLWDLVVEFPSEYPFVPPLVRFLAIPSLKDNLVSKLGRVDLSVCLSVNGNPAYHPCMTIFEILVRLYLVMKEKRNWKEVELKIEDLQTVWDSKPPPLLQLGDLVPIIGQDWRSGRETKVGVTDIPPNVCNFPIGYSRFDWRPIENEREWLDDFRDWSD
jgi:ubiquitin-protein ligase